jgi:hypothetical protein
VVVPGAIVIELVDVEVGSDEVDVLLVVEGCHVAVESKSILIRIDGWGTGEDGEIVGMPGVIVIELEDVDFLGNDVVTDYTLEVYVLLVVEVGHVAVERTWNIGGVSAGEFGEIVVVPGVIVVKLEDVDLVTDGSQEVDVLLVIEESLVAVDRSEDKRVRSTCQFGEIVVMPGVIVVEFVDVVVDTEEVDVLLVVAGGFIAGERAHPAWVALQIQSLTGVRGASQLGEIVVVPGAIVIELVDMKVNTDEVDVLLVVEGGHVAVGLAY